MTKLFGSSYDEFGSLDNNLVLKTNGKIKILWGNKFIDLLDNKGNINVNLIKKISSENLIKETGFYYTSNRSLIALVGGDQIDLSVQVDWDQEDNTKADYIKNKPTLVSAFINDAGYLTKHQSLEEYIKTEEVEIKLEETIENILNWVLELNYLTDHLDLSDYALKTELFSGSYEDLTDKPTIPTNLSDLTDDLGISEKVDSSSLADVATSGSYLDLINTPSIPQIWSGTQAQYEALSPNYDNNTIYIIT